jgi:hypothetical protein
MTREADLGNTRAQAMIANAGNKGILQFLIDEALKQAAK